MKVNFTESYHSKRWLQCLFTLHFHLFPWSKAIVKLLFWFWFHFLCHLKITSCSVKYSMQFTLLTQGKQKHLKAKKFYCLLLQQSTNLQHRAPDTGTIFNSSLCLIWQKEHVVEQQIRNQQQIMKWAESNVQIMHQAVGSVLFWHNFFRYEYVSSFLPILWQKWNYWVWFGKTMHVLSLHAQFPNNTQFPKRQVVAKTLPKAQRTQGIEYFDSSNTFSSKQNLQEAFISW